MRAILRLLPALLVLLLAATEAEAQYFRRSVRPVRPVRPLPYIDTSWQNSPYVYWMIHHHPPYPPLPPWPYPYPYPVPYPVPVDQGYTVVNNYLPAEPDAQRTTAVLPPPASNKAVVAINLPTTAAVVWIDGHKLESGLSATRVYTTPELEPGHAYHYTVKAQWVRRGDNVSEERRVRVEAGKTSVVDLTKNDKK
jgi:uncharacterized protein (TIGR03000 family)